MPEVTLSVRNKKLPLYEYGLGNQLSKIFVKKTGSTNRILFAEYSYDANGNTSTRTLYTSGGTKKTDFTYDTVNRLVRTIDNDKETIYSYDNAGNRLYKADSDGMTLYLRHGQISVAMDIEVYSPSSTEGATLLGKVNRYVLSGDLLAGRITTTVPLSAAAITAKRYYHLDHQNSTKAVSTEEGTLEMQYVYRAFGEQLRKLGTVEATYTYGGKELDEVTNLYYFNARYYDATTGRFINVDPVQDGSNWYVYCNNYPMNAVDPTGLSATVTLAIVVGLSSGATSVVSDMMMTGEINWRDAGAATIGGAITGAMIGSVIDTFGTSGVVIGTLVASGEMAGIVGEAVTDAVKGNNPMNAKSVISNGFNGVTSILTGAVIGKVGNVATKAVNNSNATYMQNTNTQNANPLVVDFKETFGVMKGNEGKVNAITETTKQAVDMLKDVGNNNKDK